MSASDPTSSISFAEAHVWKDDLSEGFVAEIFADGRWRLPTAGSQPPSIPDTSEKLLDYIKAIRKRLLQAHKVGGSQALNWCACTSTTIRDKAVFVCTLAGDFYCVPEIAPLWLAVAALVESGLPPWNGNLRGVTETVQRLTALAACMANHLEQEEGERLNAETPLASRIARRPRKGESDKDRLVISAIAKHHRYQQVGIVENYAPAKAERLAALASSRQVKVSPSTVSRFFRKKFPKHGRGYDGYIAACNRDARLTIGMLLALWQGDVTAGLADLLPHESGRSGDD